MNTINWNNVNYIESEKKLVFTEQNIQSIPEIVINLYQNRVCRLDLSHNRMTSLKGVERFSLLAELILDNNRLTEYELITQNILPQIQVLSLNNNKVNDLIGLLQRLSIYFPNIEHLCLMGNVACPFKLSSKVGERNHQLYRDTVINYLPKIKFIDAQAITWCERQRAVGHRTSNDCDTQFGARFSKFEPKILIRKFLGNGKQKTYSPLPKIKNTNSVHRVAYGKCKYKYIGENSEGNRFIFNHDL